jgi:hypothetical protein
MCAAVIGKGAFAVQRTHGGNVHRSGDGCTTLERRVVDGVTTELVGGANAERLRG